MAEPPSQASLLPAGTVVGGGYVVARYLAAGAMGAVYEVTDRAGARRAMKVLFPLGDSAGPTSLRRFEREARVTAAIAHPNIVQVLDSGVIAGSQQRFLIMEFLSGEDLGELLERTGPLHPSVACRVILQAGRGVAAAHGAGVVHRDIKPSNIFLHREGGEQIAVRVCDFGLARLADPTATKLTATGHFLGSPLYMAPEQIFRPGEADARSDVWSLGMTLYEALAGEPAFVEMRTLPELITAVDSGQLPSLQERAPWVEPGLARLVHGALLKDPAARCPSAAEFTEALEVFCGGSDRVTERMLARLPDEIRGARAERVSPPRAWVSASEETFAGDDARVDTLLGKVLNGRYRLEALLGEGGMGAVYAAAADDGRTLAVKVVRPELLGAARSAVRRFVREAKLMTAIVDPHVVSVLDADTDAALGVPFIVMEMLKGRDLSALLAERGALDPAAACRVFLEAARGVAAAHAKGIVHRDIKPANLFLHQAEGGGVCVKVCDFGIAKHVDDGDSGQSTELTRTGGMLGSPVYMSPEQARDARSVDARTDVWSLCISLYEALAGKKPWGPLPSVGEAIYTITTKDVPPLADAAPWLPYELAAVVHRGLARDPADRLGSVGELAALLEPFAAGALSEAALSSVSVEHRSTLAARPATLAGQVAATSPTSAPAPRRSLPMLGVAALLAAGVAGGVGITRVVFPSATSPAALGAAAAGSSASDASPRASASASSVPATSALAAVPAPGAPASDAAPPEASAALKGAPRAWGGRGGSPGKLPAANPHRPVPAGPTGAKTGAATATAAAPLGTQTVWRE
jgi:serine/threonine protein kinase